MSRWALLAIWIYTCHLNEWALIVIVCHHARIFDTAALANLCAPKKLLRVVASGTHVYEVDVDEYVDDDNEHGVGRFFGFITDPFGPEIMVQWADGIKEALPKKNLTMILY